MSLFAEDVLEALVVPPARAPQRRSHRILLINRRQLRKLAAASGYTQVPERALVHVSDQLQALLAERLQQARGESRKRRLSLSVAHYLASGDKPAEPTP